MPSIQQEVSQGLKHYFGSSGVWSLSSLPTISIRVSLSYSILSHFPSCSSLYSWCLSMAALPVFLLPTSCFSLSTPPEKGCPCGGWSSPKKKHAYPALGHLISHWAITYVMWLSSEEPTSGSRHHGQDICV